MIENVSIELGFYTVSILRLELHCSKVRKFQDLSVIQILHEINFGESRSVILVDYKKWTNS